MQGIAAESLTQLQEICKYIKKAISNKSCADFSEPKVFNVTYSLEAETKKKAELLREEPGNTGGKRKHCFIAISSPMVSPTSCMATENKLYSWQEYRF